MSTNNLTPKELEKFKAKYEILPNGCFKWIGTLDRDGYGMFFLRKISRRAHRVAWFNSFGAIPEGMVINHVCRNPWCVNFQHLAIFTKRENSIQDSNSICAINSRKTHCPKGHEYDSVWSKSNVRYCSVCEKEKQKRLKRKWRENDELKGLI